MTLLFEVFNCTDPLNLSACLRVVLLLLWVYLLNHPTELKMCTLETKVQKRSCILHLNVCLIECANSGVCEQPVVLIGWNGRIWLEDLRCTRYDWWQSLCGEMIGWYGNYSGADYSGKCAGISLYDMYLSVCLLWIVLWLTILRIFPQISLCLCCAVFLR